MKRLIAAALIAAFPFSFWQSASGPPPAWSPQNQGTLRNWYDFSTAATAGGPTFAANFTNGAAVGDPAATPAYDNKTGNPNPMSSSSSGKYSTYVTSVQNGLAAVHFLQPSGVVQYLDTGGASASALPLTVAVVFKADTPTNSNAILMPSNTGGLDVEVDSPGQPSCGATFVSFIGQGATATGSGFHLIVYVIGGSGGATATSCTIYLDGTAMTTTFTSGVTLTAGRTFFMGANPGLSNASEAEIGEIEIYSSALGGTDLTSLHTYIVNKWATP